MITIDMLTQFNDTILSSEPIELAMEQGIPGCVRVQLKPNRYIQSATLNLSIDFYTSLTLYFYSHGITLSFNNSGNIFWEKSERRGYGEE